ncbi:phosphotransferase family protein [Mycolicibacterium fortuitum]|uniref:phosphotransferase family protein n=1 Tax=Mycolicibacterium fortuitum TaxID=1766 RepID=UPI000AAB4D98|nr:phosphotransferase family protein [Mycolicibacterium fortuitum]
MSHNLHTDAPPGLDLKRLGRWFRTSISDYGGAALEATVLAGGKSNLTYRVTDGQHAWVVRRPPLGHVLATAHDMGREHRVMAALHDTAVPVPRVYGHCADAEVIGAPFYVMEFIDGDVYRDAAQLIAAGPATTAAIATAMVTVLADLHRVDVHRVGLDGLGKPHGYLERQVTRWARQLDASHSRDLPDAPVLINLLRRALPPDSEAALVHGDFRLDNLLMTGTTVRAVVDWEMATVGDPLTDLALLLVYGRLPALVRSPGLPDVSTAAGYPSEQELLDRYARASGRDLQSLHFHLALAYFKLAAILEGIHYRHRSGHTVGDGFATVGTAVAPLLQAGIDELTPHAKEH